MIHITQFNSYYFATITWTTYIGRSMANCPFLCNCRVHLPIEITFYILWVYYSKEVSNQCHVINVQHTWQLTCLWLFAYSQQISSSPVCHGWTLSMIFVTLKHDICDYLCCVSGLISGNIIKIIKQLGKKSGLILYTSLWLLMTEHYLVLGHLDG